MSAKLAVKPVLTCPRCQADLRHPEAVRRTFVSQSPRLGDAYGLGRYSARGAFGLDDFSDLSCRDTYEVLADADECDRCGCRVRPANPDSPRLPAEKPRYFTLADIRVLVAPEV